MTTANQDLLDAALRHQVGIRRLTAGEVRRLLELLQRGDAAFVKKLRQQLRAPGARSLASGRFTNMLSTVGKDRAQLMKEFRAELRKLLRGLSRSEADFERRALESAIPVRIGIEGATPARLREALTLEPFGNGSPLREWFRRLQLADIARVTDAVRLGVAQGEPIPDIVRRVAGTRANRFRDGVLATSRRNAEVVVRTAVNHVSNSAREKVWEENEEIIQFLQWNATLDGRTSRICQVRDGQAAPLAMGSVPAGVPKLNPPGARPPAHPQCRSVMIPILDPSGITNSMEKRPFIRDSRTRRFRERDFRADARSQAGDRWKGMTRSQRNAAVRARRDAWGDANIGQVPANITYQQWLKRQPRSFQNEVLGPARAKLFRAGKATLNQFVDRVGNELTLEQLQARGVEL